MTTFSDFGLAEPLERALAATGYTTPTPIQQQAIPALMQGRDLLGIAQTGTGKTAAFALPSLHHLSENPVGRHNAGCRMLVLSPTRELAAQIADNMRGYARFLNLSVQCVFGGLPIRKQARALERGCDVLVATPGRLLDLLENRALTLRHVEIFVLDEADQMLDLGFIRPLQQIASLLPKERQSLFFSATMPEAIAKLGKQFIHDPVKVEVTPQATTAERVEQYATFLNQAEKQALLTIRLREGLASKAIDRALVFTRTKHGADRVVRHLVTAGIGASAIHGNKSQAQRTAALQAFRSGRQPVLVATDIAARGIDVSGVSHVFNYELPNVPEQYVHRIGRTARAGADGIAISFVAPDEKAYLRDIEKLTRTKLAVMPLPEDFVVEARRLPAPARKALEADRDSGPRRDGQRRDGQRGEGRRDGRRDGPRTDSSRQPRRRDEGLLYDSAAPRSDERRSDERRPERPRRDPAVAIKDVGNRAAARPPRRDGEAAATAQPRADKRHGDNRRGGNRSPGGHPGGGKSAAGKANGGQRFQRRATTPA